MAESREEAERGEENTQGEACHEAISARWRSVACDADETMLPVSAAALPAFQGVAALGVPACEETGRGAMEAHWH